MRTKRDIYLAIAAFLTYFVAWAIFASPLDQVYWNIRYSLTERAAPASIVVVRLNPIIGPAPDEGSYYADVLEKLRGEDPRHVYLDANLKVVTYSLEREIKAFGSKLSIVVRPNQMDFTRDDASRATADIPGRNLTGSAQVVVAGGLTNFWKYVVDVPCVFRIDGHSYPSFAASTMSTPCLSNSIRPDFSVDPSTVEVIDSRDINSGLKREVSLRDKTILVSGFVGKQDGVLGYLGHRQQSLAMHDVAALSGHPIRRVDLEILATIFTILITVAQSVTRQFWRWSIYAGAASAALFGPVLFEGAGILVPAGSTLVVMTVFAAWRMWSRWRRKVIETGNAGLPNFVALGGHSIPAGYHVVVAVIGRYEEFLATLPPELHAECAHQIARRFSVGCGTAEIFHGEGGHFAWIEHDRDADNQIEHFEGMRALFSAPLLVGGHMFDTNVHFGIDRNGQFDTLTRLNTAIASATDALRTGRTVEQFEANRLANAHWELSLLARIDEGMRNGDIWLAYQPQWDYGENRISGAEALIRWNDPVRGPIRPDEFILQAERAGRIDALTYWVLEQAITSAEIFNALGPRFQMSINLSAQLVDKPSLVSATAEIVRRRGIDPHLLTVEVTETASVYNRPAAIRNLGELQAMGFRLSIDDFGTGEASLCYLADLPSNELKLDRRFVSRIVESDRDRKIVASTIKLAHALGQTVVGEGIEDLATFELLRKLKCDVAQGYYVGKPETLEQLRFRYLSLVGKQGKAFTSC